jgi:hypothetical protein
VLFLAQMVYKCKEERWGILANVAITTAKTGLYVRNAPEGTIIGGLPLGSRVDVWKEQNGWAVLTQDATQLVR